MWMLQERKVPPLTSPGKAVTAGQLEVTVVQSPQRVGLLAVRLGTMLPTPGGAGSMTLEAKTA